MIEAIIFYLFGTVLVLASIGVVSAKNPVYSILLLIFAFFNAAAIFVLLKAEFLAMVLIIVYVGAVAVLFLFVVMLINLRTKEKRKVFTKYTLFALLLLVVLGVELFVSLFEGIAGINPVVMDSNFAQLGDAVLYLGQLFFNQYYYLFLVGGLILTVAMIGAVIIVDKETSTTNQRQDVFLQNIRSRENSVKAVKVEIERGIK
ncbi:MAG: NADH-quinone oxidoreductase subunit J [Alphaproteobacteria bacterium]|jgi:NADH-quinone oxidoreductase subunit J|nr:NADH-quinone oxidoreductase subunit J [Alphaproteobacteria bacterium]